MNSEVNVVIKQDNSVQKAIELTAKKLKSKYGKERKVNEKLLKPKTKLQKVLSIITNFICGFVILACAFLFVGTINAKIQRIPPSFAGFSSMLISSGSMTESGFAIGDRVIVKAVDTHTLKDGDIIAFYVHSNTYSNFNINNCRKINADSIDKLKYKVTFSKFFGNQNEYIKKAAALNCAIVFHHILGVYEDANGTRWFKTYGSTNVKNNPSNVDSWAIREELVVGAYDNSGGSKFIAGTLNTFSTNFGMIMLIFIPLICLAIMIIWDLLKDIERNKLELDIIEEKRKITDPICVRNKIGFKMDDKTKYKVLAQAKEEEKLEYISLLWEEEKTPTGIKKYYLRKGLMLKPIERLCEVNRECEKRFKAGENEKEIAKYYIEEKKKIQDEQLRFERRFRKIRKEYEKKKLEEEKLKKEKEVA